MTVIEENAEPTVETAEPAERPPSSERWVFVFLAALIAFNLFIFFGSRETGGRTDSNTPPPPPPPSGGVSAGSPSPGVGKPPPPSPGTTAAPAPVNPSPGGPSPGAEPPPPSSPPPPPPPQQGGAPRGLAGPELILGIVALKGSPEAALTPQQEAAITKILARMEAPQAGLQKAADAAMSYLSPKQVEWMRMNRGPAATSGDDDVEPGMDPVTSAAYRLLKEKGASAKGEPQVHQHQMHDLHFHDLLNGVLKMQGAGADLALTPEQAKAIAARVEEGNRSRKEENDLFEEMFRLLDKEQTDYLQAHPELVKTDVNALILRYAQMRLKE